MNLREHLTKSKFKISYNDALQIFTNVSTQLKSLEQQDKIVFSISLDDIIKNPDDNWEIKNEKIFKKGNMKIVIDTNVLVSGLRSKRGNVYRLLSMIPSRKFKMVLSVPFLMEYTEVLNRPGLLPTFKKRQIEKFLDLVCKFSEHQEVCYLWRPMLKHSGDDLVVELAFASGAKKIVTFNIGDFHLS